jgi:hypothetical protein
MNQITKYVWVGNSSDARNVDQLRAKEITAVLTVACDFDCPIHKGYRVRREKVGLIDGPGNSCAEYGAAILKLMGIVARGYTVLCHCHEGVSRSPSVVLGYLMATRLLPTYQHALYHITTLRPETSIDCIDGTHWPQIKYILPFLAPFEPMVQCDDELIPLPVSQDHPKCDLQSEGP